MKLLLILLTAIWAVTTVLLWAILSTSPVVYIIVLPTSTPLPTVTAAPSDTPTVFMIPTLGALPTLPWAFVPPTDTPYIATPTPTPSATPYVVTATPPAVVCACSADLYNCPDLGDQVTAQACFDYCLTQGAGDIHRLDQNNNDVACEDN